MTDQVGLCTFVMDGDGRGHLPYVSEACADLFGVTAEQARSDVAGLHDAIHPDDRQRLDDDGRRSRATLEPMWWEGRIVRPDRSVRAVLISARPTALAGGRTEWTGMVLERPRRHVVPSGRDARTDALAMLGHDLAGPLTAIMLSAELALEEADTAPASEHAAAVARRRLHTILRQARRLSHMREDALLVAAADTGTIGPRGEAVELQSELSAAADLQDPRVRFVVEAQAGLTCWVQPSHLSRILTNLVSNAARHATDEVRLSAVRVGDRVLITVADDGSGVPLDVEDRLFHRFAHHGEDVRPAGAGSGLGLWIVRTLAQANLGTAGYARAEPGGARFTVMLPLTAPGPSAASTRRPGGLTGAVPPT